MREVFAKLGEDIRLGRRGENLATRVTFDVSGWMSSGDGTIHLLHQRNGDNVPYPCAITVNGGTVTWEITAADVEVAGRGRAELQYLDGDVCKKSAIYTTNTLRALNKAGKVPPEPEEGWVRQVLEARAAAESAASDAQGSVQTAEGWAHDAESSAQEARGAASQAQNAASQAQSAAGQAANQAAYLAAQQAATEVETRLAGYQANAASSAQSALQSSQVAAQSAQEAGQSAYNANANALAATAAQKAAEEAQSAAETAADAAAQSEGNAKTFETNAAASAKEVEESKQGIEQATRFAQFFMNEAEQFAEQAEAAAAQAQSAADRAEAVAESSGIMGAFEHDVLITLALYNFATGKNTSERMVYEDQLELHFYNGGEEIIDHSTVFATMQKNVFVPFTTMSRGQPGFPRYELALEQFSTTETDGAARLPKSIEASGYNKTDGFSIHIVYTYDYDNPDTDGNPTHHSVMTLTKDALEEIADIVNDTINAELGYDSEKWGEVKQAVTSENLIASGDVEWSYGYLAASNGVAPNNTDENWRHTPEYIPVAKDDSVNIKNSIIAHGSVAMIACYDENRGYMAAQSQTLVRGETRYTIPAGVAYVRLSLGNKAGGAVKFDTQEVYLTTTHAISTPKENIDNLYTKVNALEETSKQYATATPLAGKIVFLAGDSRSSTDYTFYKELIEAKCGCTALVKGASGRNVAYNASDAYMNQLAANAHDFSLWIVGGNDTGAAGTIGTFSADSVNGKSGESVVSETDISVDYAGTCFVQAVDHMMRKYKAMLYNFKELGNRHFPKMIFCTDLPQQRSNATSAWSLKENWERKRNAIIECCEKNNVACLDLYKLCNFDMSFEPYWVSPTDKVNDNGLYFMDGLHPNRYGIDVITSLEIEEMKRYVIVSDYIKPRLIVSDGLVMYCDGINNTGNGHNANTTTWADLSGNGNNLINVSSVTSTTADSSLKGEWLDSGMRVITGLSQYLRTVNSFDVGADRTLEMMVTLNEDNYMCLGFNGADRVKFRAAGANFWVRVSAADSGGTTDVQCNSATRYNTQISVAVTRSYDASAGNTTYKTYVDGVYMTSLKVSGNHRAGESAHLLFGMEVDDVTIHSVRVYNRALTDDEVKNNYFYDVDHFYDTNK